MVLGIVQTVIISFKNVAKQLPVSSAGSAQFAAVALRSPGYTYVAVSCYRSFYHGCSVRTLRQSWHSQLVPFVTKQLGAGVSRLLQY